MINLGDYMPTETNIHNEQLHQDFPIRKHCSECGRRIREDQKFRNGLIHAMNGDFIFTTGDCCLR